MNNPKIGLLFPGGGAQYVGMGKYWYDHYDSAKNVYQEAEEILGFSLKKICFEGDLDTLSQMDKAQPATFVTSVAAFKVFEEIYGVKPIVAAGHSLGEFAAIHCSGAIDFGSILKLVALRGKLLKTAGKEGSMMAVNKLTSKMVDNCCEELQARGIPVYVAVYNSPLQQVISGTKEGILLLQDKLIHEGGETTILNISTSSHCPLMQDAADEFRAALDGLSFDHFEFPVISNLTAQPFTECDDAQKIMFDHMIKPVMWQKSMLCMGSYEPDIIIEIGPQSVLKKMLEYNLPEVGAYAWDVESDRSQLDKVLPDVDTKKLRLINTSLRIVASTKNHNAANEDYSSTFKQAYQELKEMHKSKQARMDKTSIQKIPQLLSTILEEKQIPASKIEHLIDSIRSYPLAHF